MIRAVGIASRALRRTPGFTITVITSLGLGLALAASAIAIANAYLVRSLPYPNANRLYHVMYAPPGPVEPRGMTAVDWTALNDVVDAAITSSGESFYLEDVSSPRSARGIRASPGFLSSLGVRVALGRPLGHDDFAVGAETAVLIGDALWRERFGADSTVVGRVVRVTTESQPDSAETIRIVGVLAPGFWYGRDSQDRVDILAALRSPARTYMVRLREGVPIQRAELRITAAARSVATWLPPGWPGVKLESVHERYVATVRPTLVAMVVAAGLALGITCANVAVLVLLRSMRRRREMAVRIALGAGRRHLFRLVLAEVGILCAAGLGAGVALSSLALRALRAVIQTELGKPAPGGDAAIALRPLVLAGIAGVAIVVTLGLAFVPVLAPFQRRLGDALRAGPRGGGDTAALRRVRASLVALEVAGSLSLLVACGLMIQSAIRMANTDLGFDTDQLVRARVILRGATYRDAASFARFYEAATDHLTRATNATPAFITWPPFYETPEQEVQLENGRAGAIGAGVIGVGGGYFSTLRIALRQGREFTAADRLGSEDVAIVSETLARQLWPSGAALGARIRTIAQTGAGPDTGPWRTVVGVVGDVHQTYDDHDQKDIYVPFLQTSLGRFASFYVHTAQPLSTLTPTLRSAIAEIDRQAVVAEPTMVASEDRQRARTRFLTSALTSFATFASLLAMLGIYGTIAYAVQQREREIAIRMAIGAPDASIIALFLTDGARVIAAGMTLGLLGALWLARLLQNQLVGVSGFDTVTVSIASAIIASAGMAAIWWPARRAASTNPVAALSALD